MRMSPPRYFKRRPRPLRHAVRCFWCDSMIFRPGTADAGRDPKRIATLDHVIPQSRGGKRTVAACLSCNRSKASLYPWDWIEHVLVGEHKAHAHSQWLKWAGEHMPWLLDGIIEEE